jgi:deoxyribonuclease-2
MGSCFSCCSVVTIHVVLKLPHGQKGLLYHNGAFVPMESVQDWVQSLYSFGWTGWTAYNDDTTVTNKKTKGHCKGVVTWNASKIGWLIHSVPHFPTEITTSSISPILPSELIYGQSFVYLEMPYSKEGLETILKQIEWMDANLFLQYNMPVPTSYFSATEIKKMIISPTIDHYSKPSHYVLDIYGEHLCELDKSTWYVETWRRGSAIQAVTPNLHDVKTLGWFAVNYKESQDHSKWAVCKNCVWIGDLNRMESQMKRGGGGVVIRDAKMVKAFRGLIIN